MIEIILLASFFTANSVSLDTFAMDAPTWEEEHAVCMAQANECFESALVALQE